MSINNIQELEKVVNSELTGKIQNSYIKFNELLIESNVNELINIIQFLKTDDKCKFRQLIDIVGVDYPEEEKRFRLIYLFLSHENNLRIKLSVSLESEKKIPTLTKIFPSANWMEREVFDMYGIEFEGHPHPKRLLMPEDWKGWPLRKDYVQPDFYEMQDAF